MKQKKRLFFIVIAIVVTIVIGVVVMDGGTRAPQTSMLPLAGDMAGFQLSEKRKRFQDFVFYQGDGVKTSLSDFRGKLLLVNLWATWCAPCVEELPALSALNQKFSGADFEVIAISLDRRADADKIEAFLKKHKAENLPVYLDRDRDVQKNATYQGLPITYLLDRKGRLIGTLPAPADWQGAAAVELIKYFLSE